MPPTVCLFPYKEHEALIEKSIVGNWRQAFFPQPERPCEAWALRLSLSKKWLAPLFRGFHSSLAPTARPGSYAGKPLLRKAFCGFDAHVAKSDYSLRGLRPPSPQGFLDKLSGPGAFGPGSAQLVAACRKSPAKAGLFRL